MNGYKAEYFTLSELVHPQLLKDIGDNNALMRLDSACLRDIDTIRQEWHDIHKSGVYCNRISKGIDSRGLRPPDDVDGSKYSIHKQGQAFDLEPVNGKHKEFYLFCKNLINNGELMAFNTMEDIAFTPTWTHMAKMNHSLKLVIIKP